MSDWLFFDQVLLLCYYSSYKIEYMANYINNFEKTLNSFTAWLQANVNYSQESKKGYLHVARSFLAYLYSFNIPRLSDADVDLLLKFIHFNKDKEYSPKTVRLRLSALSLFYKWAYKNRYSKINLITEYKKINLNKQSSLTEKTPPEINFAEILSAEEQLALINLPIEHEPLAIRNKSIVLLILASALYAEETINLLTQELDLSAGCITLKNTDKRARRINLDLTICEQSCTDWLAARDMLGKNCDYLFVARAGEQLTKRMLYKIVSQYLANAQISKKHLGPELLRQTAICNMLLKGLSLEEIQENTGIETLASLEKYKHMVLNPKIDRNVDIVK